MERRGLVQVYTGTGKGKTTAALGLGLRAAGHGWKVCMIQFMKGKINYGELEGVERVEGMTIEQFGRPDFVDKENPAQVDIDWARKGFERAREIMASGECDMIILDEINVAVDFNLLKEEEVLEMIRNRPAHLEAILTGRYASPGIINIADLVSVVSEVKHPYMENIPAREGIDF